MANRSRKAHIEGWISQLNGDRVEIFLKVERADGVRDRKIRASGPQAEMMELCDWFEEKTGLTVNVPGRVRTFKPPPGQTELFMTSVAADAIPELESEQHA